MQVCSSHPYATVIDIGPSDDQIWEAEVSSMSGFHQGADFREETSQ